MIRVNHSSSSEEEEEMARFSVGRDEHDNDEGGPCNSSTSVCKRRRTTAGPFSRGVVIRQQEEVEERERERVVQEKVEEEAEEEDWGSESEGNFRSSGDRRVPVRESEVLRENRSISGESMYQNFEDSIINRSISVTLLDPDVLDCPICFEHLCVPVFQVSSFYPFHCY